MTAKNAPNKVQVPKLEAYMRANWGKETMQEIAERFQINDRTVRRYAKRFNLIRGRKSTALKSNQKLTENGVLTVTGAITRHELRG